VGIFLGLIFFVVAFLVIGMILLQEGKGGGIAAMGGAAMDNMVGGRNPLRKMTAYFLVAFVVLVLVINYSIKQRGKQSAAPKGLQEMTKEAEPVAAAGESTPELVVEEPKTENVAEAADKAGEAVATAEKTAETVNEKAADTEAAGTEKNASKKDTAKQ